MNMKILMVNNNNSDNTLYVHYSIKLMHQTLAFTQHIKRNLACVPSRPVFWWIG